jgi:hypothetical protein
MSTTALFIELLITGLQAFLWLILVALTTFDYRWMSLDKVKGFEAILAVLLLPIVYPMGVIVDNWADKFFRPWEKRIRSQYALKNEESTTRFFILTKETYLAAQMSYIRSRIRISRATAVNAALITATLFFFLVFRCWELPAFPLKRALAFELIIGTLMALLSALTWKRLNHAFFSILARGHNPATILEVGETAE